MSKVNTAGVSVWLEGVNVLMIELTLSAIFPEALLPKPEAKAVVYYFSKLLCVHGKYKYYISGGLAVSV